MIENVKNFLKLYFIVNFLIGVAHGFTGEEMLVIGDSLACGIGKELKKSWPDAVVECKVSSGLIRRDFFNWQEKAEEIVREREKSGKSFKWVFVILGINDSRQIPSAQIYRQRIREFLEIFRAHGAKIFWVSPPPCTDKNPPKEGELGLARAAFDICQLIKDELSLIGVEYLDFWDYLANENKEAKLELRSKDQLHFLPETSLWIGTKLIKKITEIQ